MKSTAFRYTVRGPHVLKVGQIIKGQDGEPLRVTSIHTIELEAYGGKLTVIGRCKPAIMEGGE